MYVCMCMICMECVLLVCHLVLLGLISSLTLYELIMGQTCMQAILGLLMIMAGNMTRFSPVHIAIECVAL